MSDQLSSENEILLAIKKYNIQYLYDKIKSSPDIVTTPFRDVLQGRYGTGCTPLHIAAYYCRPLIVKMLLERGANVDAKNNEGVTPAWLVLGFNARDNYLMAPDCRWNTTDARAWNRIFSPVKNCSEMDPYTDISTHEQEERGDIPVPISGTECMFTCMHILLKYQMNPFIYVTDRCSEARSLVVEAIRMHYLYVARLLLEHANVDHTLLNNDLGIEVVKDLLIPGYSNKVVASLQDMSTKLYIFTRLYDLGLPCDSAFPGTDQTILHRIATTLTIKPLTNEFEPHELLLEPMAHSEKWVRRFADIAVGRGTNVNAKDIFGNTALHYAMEYLQPALALSLLESGANLQQKNCKGRSAADMLFESDQFLLLLKMWFGDLSPYDEERPPACAKTLRQMIAPFLFMTAILTPFIPNWRVVIFRENGSTAAIFDYLLKVRDRRERGELCDIKDFLFDLVTLFILSEQAQGRPPPKDGPSPTASTKRFINKALISLLPGRQHELVKALNGDLTGQLLTSFAMQMVEEFETDLRLYAACAHQQPLPCEYERLLRETSSSLNASDYFEGYMRTSRRINLCQELDSGDKRQRPNKCIKEPVCEPPRPKQPPNPCHPLEHPTNTWK